MATHSALNMSFYFLHSKWTYFFSSFFSAWFIFIFIVISCSDDAELHPRQIQTFSSGRSSNKTEVRGIVDCSSPESLQFQWWVWSFCYRLESRLKLDFLRMWVFFCKTSFETVEAFFCGFNSLRYSNHTICQLAHWKHWNAFERRMKRDVSA